MQRVQVFWEKPAPIVKSAPSGVETRYTVHDVSSTGFGDWCCNDRPESECKHICCERQDGNC